MTATTTMPTVAPISSVKIRKTCFSRSRTNDAHFWEEKLHWLFWPGSRASLNSVSGRSLNTVYLAFLGSTPGTFLAVGRAADFQHRVDGIAAPGAARAQFAAAVSCY